MTSTSGNQNSKSIEKQNSAKKWPEQVVMYTDGASRGNPGPAAIGIYIVDLEHQVLCEYSQKVGTQTNNFAEYTAVVRALELAERFGAERVIIRSDSELMVKQMTGVYKVKSPAIIPLHAQAVQALKRFKGVKFEHVRREFNVDADRLANEALDGMESSF